MAFTDSIAGMNASALRTFGESILYRADGGKADPVERTVVWSESEGIKGVRGTIWAPESSFATPPAKNDIIERNSVEYRVTDPPEGVILPRDGAYTLYLAFHRNVPNT